MSEKPLDKQNRDELVATAEGLGLEVADDLTKAQIVELIEAAPAPAAPDHPDAAPVELIEADDDSGLVTITRPITEFASNGDWVDPFSGLRVHHGSTVCQQSGASRDEENDTASVRVTVERAAELGA